MARKAWHPGAVRITIRLGTVAAEPRGMSVR